MLASAKLVELRDAYRVPAWLVLKLLYASAPIPVLFRLAGAWGVLRSVGPAASATALRRLERRLGDRYTASERRRITRRHFAFREQNELAKLWPQIRAFEGGDRCRIIGAAHLDAALTARKGAIVLTAHFGYARLIKPLLRAHGYDAWLVGRGRAEVAVPPFTRVGAFVHSDLLGLPRFSRYDEASLETVGPDIAAGINLRPHLAALARNEVLIMLPDGGEPAVRRGVRLLGREVPLATGAVTIAARTGAPILAAFAVDDPEARGVRMRLEISPPLELETGGGASEDVDANLQRFASVLEEYIKMYPHLWQNWTSGRHTRRRGQKRTGTSAVPA